MKKIFLLAALLAVGACSFTGSNDRVQPQTSATTIASATAPAAAPSPLVDFVSRAQIGSWAELNDPQLGRVQVMLEREYYSASDQMCRRLNVRSLEGAMPESLVLCQEPTGWSAVRLPQTR